MSSEPTLFDNLIRRRVFPIVGMYIAATWLVIELGDWITERFNLPANLTSYVFVAMVVMLPAVALVAYNHGAPGRDRWTRTERVFVPVNMLVAAAMIYLFNPGLDASAATEMMEIADETGQMQTFEVARQGYHQEVIGYFWENLSADDETDWLSYGLPMILAHDLARVSPVLSVPTPFDSNSMMRRLRNQGFERMRDLPRGLAVEIARDRRSAAFILGSYRVDGYTISLNASMYDAESGDLIGTHSVTTDDWLAGVDEISEAILGFARVEPADNQSDDPVSEHLSDSIEAIRHYSSGNVLIELDNDYAGGIAELQAAVDADPAFAEARSRLSVAEYLSGDVAAARISASRALSNSYRLSNASRFGMKAQQYLYDGDLDKGIQVVDIWTQVEPNSTRALEAKARLSRIKGTDEALESAISAFDQLLKLNPDDVDVYRQKALVEQQRGNFDAAANLLQQFLGEIPDSSGAHIQLSEVYQAQGRLADAQAALETASILSETTVASEIGLARLEARRGMFDDASRRLNDLLSPEANGEQRMETLIGKAEIAAAQGKISEATDLLTETNELAKDLVPPAIRLVTIESQLGMMLSMAGDTQAALTLMDSIVAQLQPPMSDYMNFSYMGIYGMADMREETRAIVEKTLAIESQLPAPFLPFVEMGRARLATWNGDDAIAVGHVDRAFELLGQSHLAVVLKDLSGSDMFINAAELYVDAGATAKARERLEGILKVYPASAYARLVLAKALLAEGDAAQAKTQLEEAVSTWSGADRSFVLLVEAQELLADL